MVLSKKGKIMSPSGTIAAYIDDCITEVDGKIFLNTVCTSKCELLCTSIKCASCKATGQIYKSYTIDGLSKVKVCLLIQPVILITDT